MASDSFGARRSLSVGDRTVDIYALEAAGDGVAALPYSLKVLLENLLRNEDGVKVGADDVAHPRLVDPRPGALGRRSPSPPPGC